MNHDEKFWLILWSILGALILLAITLGIYAGYLNDKRDEAYISQDLQPYTVTNCVEFSTRTEWHGADWQQTNSTLWKTN